MGNIGKIPLIFFGSEENFSSWTVGGGTVTVTSGQTDVFGGTTAYRVQDTSATVAAFIFRVITLPTLVAGEMLVGWLVKNVDSTSSDLKVRDTTAGVDRVTIRLTWSGATLSSASVVGGNGTALTPIALNDGWYLVLHSVTGLVAANAHRLELYPSRANVADQLSVLVYRRSFVMPGWFDDVKAHPRPKPGSAWARGVSAEDAWVPGVDYLLTGVLRWIPTLYLANPVMTGWDSDGKDIGCNAGVNALLKSAWDLNTVRFVPDRADCRTYYDTLLESPREEGAEDQEEDGTRALAITLRNNADAPFVNY